ncbi:hypothetical protein Tco_0946923, partial [Tanacetum coccineum]
MKRVNTFVDMNSEVVKGSETRTEESSKRAGDELESNMSNKQKIDEHVEVEKDDQEEAEMKRHIKIVKDDEVAIDAIPLATKPLVIVDYKIDKDGRIKLGDPLESWNQGGSSTAPAAEGSNTQDSQGKGIMVDKLPAPSVVHSRSRLSFQACSSFKDVFGDAIHMDFFPFSAGPCHATYPKGGIAGNCEFTHGEWDAPYRLTFGVLTKEVFKDPAIYKTVVDQFPTPGEMVRVKICPMNQMTVKMSMLHCMMMSRSGELLARYHGLNQSHYEYVLSADSKLKGYEEKVANMTGLELQVVVLKKQVPGLNDKLTSSDASFSNSKAKGKERKKKIKSLGKSLDNLHAEVARLSAALNQATILEAERDDEILRGELLFLAASAGFEHGLSMHRTKDEFVVVLKKMVNFVPGAQEMLAEAFLLVAQTDYAFLKKISEYVAKPLSIILQLEPKKLVRPANVPTKRDARVSPPVAKELIMTPASKSLELSANVDLTPSIVASEHNEEMVNAEVDGSDPQMIDNTITAKSEHAFMQGMSVILDDVVELAGVGAVVDPSRRILSHATRPNPNGFPPGTFSIVDQAFIGSMGCILLSEADIILSCLSLELAWLLVFPSSLVGALSLYDVVVHRSYSPKRRGPLCVLSYLLSFGHCVLVTEFCLHFYDLTSVDLSVVHLNTMADVNVNAPAEQAPAMAPPTCTNDQILPRIKWVPIGKRNCYLDVERSQSNPIYNIVVDILKHTNFFRVFTASSTIPSIYIQQFWDTVRYDNKTVTYIFETNNAFSSPPTPDALIKFVNNLGYPRVFRTLSDVVTNDMFQLWRALTIVINLCLTGKTSGFERPRAPVLQI